MEISRTVSVIKATPEAKAEASPVRRRVAGYARVSTDKDEQIASCTSQIDYYTKYISSHDGWDLVKVYSDEGASGTSTKRRAGFCEMISEALAGKIDLIVTKSISRFARNTVDSLTTIRMLKGVGCECYFEKENIYTFDSKGEFLITILSSLAQEESRSISENVTWGMRKRFSDGRYSIHCSEFLGYTKGPEGKIIIDEAEASVVRRIYHMCVEGLSPYAIAEILTRDGIMTPMKKERWSYSVVKSILLNEKYVGDALLQKTYCTDYLTKRRKKNDGEIPKYYVENGHPAIVSRELAAEARKALAEYKPKFSVGGKKYSGKIVCSVCGHLYTETVWHGRKTVWGCGKRSVGENCRTPYLTESDIDVMFRLASDKLSADHSLYLSILSLQIIPERVISSLICEKNEIENYGSESSPRLAEIDGELTRAAKTNDTIHSALSSDDVLFPIPPSDLIDRITVSPDRSFSVTFKNSDHSLFFSSAK
ncbi:MAG: recombinase family protein [Clostridia bacterium]|nr:recombinase family protein [Clostridia bacterium]